MFHSMKRGLAGVAMLIFALTMHPATTVSQPEFNCTGRSELQRYLGTAYAEKIVAVGMVNEQAIMEVYVADSGTWTVVLTSPAGVSCLVLAGQGWQSTWRKPGQKA